MTSCCSIRQWLRISILVVLAICVLPLSCRKKVTNPEDQTGSLRIQACDTLTLAKAVESISQVHCTVMQGAEQVHDGDHTEADSQFVIVIEDLEPAEDYSVLLLGQDDALDVRV